MSALAAGGAVSGGPTRGRTPLIVGAAALVAVGSLCASSPAGATPRALPAGCQAAGAGVSCQFHFTGAAQTFAVPAGVDRVAVDLIGAAGGDGCSRSDGGAGARVLAPLRVTPGEVLQVNVGGRGGDALDRDARDCGLGKGGFNGGANGGFPTVLPLHPRSGGGGGGASDIRRGSFSLTERAVAAGGGEGGSGIEAGRGGDAGATALAGTSGGDGQHSQGGRGGSGATPTRPGMGGIGGPGAGCGGEEGDAGQVASGGVGGSEDIDCGTAGGEGGGGGGGVYGGGGGGQGGFANVGGQGLSAGGGGGGGSSAGPAGALIGTAATPDGNGDITISYQATLGACP